MRPGAAAAVSVIAAFVTVLPLAFLVRPYVSLSDDAFGTIIGLAIPATGILLFLLLSGWRPDLSWRPTLPGRHTPDEHVPIAPDPVRAAYLADREIVVTCEHLRPVERTLRQTGIHLQLLGASLEDPRVSAHCFVNFPELQRLLNLPPSITYNEGYMPERTPFDHPFANLVCADCSPSLPGRAVIDVLHPQDSRQLSPWFPNRPAHIPFPEHKDR